MLHFSFLFQIFYAIIVATFVVTGVLISLCLKRFTRKGKSILLSSEIKLSKIGIIKIVFIGRLFDGNLDQ